MKAPRPYGDGCAAAHATELIGERWALLVVRELLLGPKRYADIGRGLPRVSPTVLSQRLRELQDVGIVRRRRLGPPASTTAYELTPWGLELEPIVLALARWAAQSPALDRDAALSPDSLILHLRARYEPADAGVRHDRRYEIRLPDDVFTVTATDRDLTVHRGTATDPDATIETDTPALTNLVFGRTTLDKARSEGSVHVDGNLDGLRELFVGFAEAG